MIEFPETNFKRKQFIDREKEIQEIESCIHSVMKYGNVELISIEGEGGIGKTSLLMHVKKQYLFNHKTIVSGIIDFFDIATTTPVGFLSQIINQFPSYHKIDFAEYDRAIEKADEFEFPGADEKRIRKELKKIRQSFVKCFNNMTKEITAILLIDTFELVQDTLGIQLSQWVSELKNSVIILAGRNNSSWFNTPQVQESLKNVKYLNFELSPFPEKAISKLIKKFDDIKDFSSDEIAKLHILTTGLPILTILACDKNWPKAGSLANEFPLIEHAYTSQNFSLEELQKYQENNPKKLEKIRTQFQKEIILGIHQMHHLGRPVYLLLYMALIYRFMNIELMAYLLDEENPSSLKPVFETLNDWTFMKHDPETDCYMLHDLVRELIMKWGWPTFDPVMDEPIVICQKAIEFYDNWLKDIDEKYEYWMNIRKSSILRKNGFEEKNAFKQLKILKRKRHQIEAHKVYYTIYANHRSKNEIIFSLYKDKYVDNLWAREKEANKLLENEKQRAINDLKLNGIEIVFSSHEDKLLKARRLITVKGQYEEAHQILNQLFELDFSESSKLFKADVLLYKGIAYQFEGDLILAKNYLTDAISLLESIED